jgi:hypothetical protein
MPKERIGVIIPADALERIDAAVPEDQSRSSYLVESALDRIWKAEQTPEARAILWQEINMRLGLALKRVRELEIELEGVRMELDKVAP